MSQHSISGQALTLRDLEKLIHENVSLVLSDTTKKRIVDCREYLDARITKTTQPLYGINTGFGSLYNRNINTDQLEHLQENLVKSHACGTGPDVPREITKLMLFLKV